MQFCLFLLTSKIFPTLWTLLRLPTSLVFTLSANVTGEQNTHIQIFANYLDPHSKPGHMSLYVDRCNDRYIQSTCATSGEGLYEGLDWLSNNIANKVLTITLYLLSFNSISHLIISWSLETNFQRTMCRRRREIAGFIFLCLFCYIHQSKGSVSLALQNETKFLLCYTFFFVCCSSTI